MQELSIEEKKELLRLARDSILSKLEGREFHQQTENKKFLEKKGVFVSLHKGKELRGCIGFIDPVTNIWQAVIENAQAAAFDDPRFLPLQAQELDDVKIEISILSVPEKSAVDSIRPGIDGVVLKYGLQKGTYLPQVWEHFKTKEDFLDSLCIKSGLSEGCFLKPDLEIYTYQSDTFSE